MTAPIESRLRGIDLTIHDEDERLAATLSALRRRATGEALEELDRWRPAWQCMDDKQAELTRWIRDECRLHVREARFEYAIALIERYRRQPFCNFKESR